MFVAQVVGRSMEPAMPDGGLVPLLRPGRGRGARAALLVELRDEIDPETGERYNVKRYQSEKAARNEDGDGWCHARVTLKPRDPRFPPIVLAPQDEGQVHVVAELVEVLDRQALDTGPKPALPATSGGKARRGCAPRTSMSWPQRTEGTGSSGRGRSATDRNAGPRCERQACWPPPALGRGHCDSANESLSSERLRTATRSTAIHSICLDPLSLAPTGQEQPH